MEFLSVARRRTESFGEAEFAAVLDAEAEAVRVLYSRGVVRSAWSREDVPGACMLLEAASFEDANAAIASLPLVVRGMLEVTLIPLRGYRGFGPQTT